MKNKVQRFGKFLSGMVMPNIGALIAFGFLAALFIDTGWIPNKGFSSMVGPMLTYLIPVLIASTGGRMIGGDRGRVVGAIAVVGAIMSNTDITMLWLPWSWDPWPDTALRNLTRPWKAICRPALRC